MLFHKNLVKSFGSPLYVYDLTKITEAYNKLRNALPDRSDLLYSLKSNPNPSVVKHLIELGCHAEVSSKKELDIALEANIQVNNCLYTGPGKTNSEINYALSRGVTHFSVESIEELLSINELSLINKTYVKVTLRINPKVQASTASINMTGVSSQFGFDEEHLDNVKLNLFTSEFVSIEGLHIYSGSNLENIDKLLNNFKSIITTIKEVSKKLNINLKFVDLGGGFSAPYGKLGELIDYENIKEALNNIIISELGSDVQIAFESGRYLTATSGVLIGTVQSLKESKGKKFCIVDFGINNLGGMSGLRRLPSSNFDIVPLNKLNQPLTEAAVVGPLCTPLDYINKKTKIPPLTRGDSVYIPNVGAYGLTASLIGFLSREIPKEVVVEKEFVKKVYNHNIIQRSISINNEET
ncbi:decarboxylase [Bacillus atrophaeus]|uniref:decarboxylase n=1 Tax=Bacillus atrophaeus TaxID=1452 RepID=UPI0031B9AE93